jgi:hypothetical protein
VGLCPRLKTIALVEGFKKTVNCCIRAFPINLCIYRLRRRREKKKPMQQEPNGKRFTGFMDYAAGGRYEN